MIEHLVLFKLKPGTTEAQIKTLTDALLSMKSQIPGILEISAGVNNSPEGKDQGFNFGLLVRFEDAAARDGYLPHPVHVQTGKDHIRPLVEDVLVLDFES